MKIDPESDNQFDSNYDICYTWYSAVSEIVCLRGFKYG